jgi:hypothetical protein
MKNNILLINLITIILLINHNISWDYTATNTPIIQDITNNNDIRPSIAALNSGDYIITWDSATSSTVIDVYFMIISSTGATKVKATKVNTVGDVNYWSTVTTDNSGGFVIVWTNTIDPTACQRIDGVYARYFDSSYTGGVEKLINTQSLKNCPAHTITSVLFMNSNFIVCCNSSLQRFDNGINLIGAEFTGIKIIYYFYQHRNCVLSDLGNGYFVAVFLIVQSLYYNVTKESDFSSLKGNFYLNHLPNIQSDPSVSFLSSGQFVIAWLENGNTITKQVYNLTGTASTQKIYINLTMTIYNPIVRSLGVNGYIIAYNTGDNLAYRLFDNSSVENGGEKIIPGAISSSSSIAVFGNASTLVSVHSDLTRLYINSTSFAGTSSTTQIPKCTTFSLIIGPDDSPKIKIPFISGTGIYITLLPIKGTLTNSAGTTLETTAQYSETDVYYNLITPSANDSFSYTNKLGDPTCQVSIFICYISCGSCTAIGDITNHQCETCNSKSGYFPLIDNTTNCYQSAIPPDGYYLDNNTWKKCYTGCQACTDYPLDPSTDMKCIKCSNGYLQQGTNCYSNSQKCFQLCKTCTEFPTDPSKDMLCKTCITNYFPKVDEPSNCFTGVVQLYYLDIDIYRKCYPSCLTCTTLGTESNHQCTSCLTNYYPKVDNRISCFTGDQGYYYFDGSIYQKCYSTCKTCTNLPGSDSNHQCTQCISDYFPKIDNISSCFTGYQYGYYLDKDIYKQNEENNQQAGIVHTLKFDTCNPSPCLNSGVCTIVLNKFQCNCTGNYIGSMCQYETNTINIQDLVNNYYQTQSQQSIYDLLSVISAKPNLISEDIAEQLYQSISNLKINFS